MGVHMDNARRPRRNASISSSSSATSVVVSSPRSRRKCATSIQRMLLFLMFGTVTSIILCWEITSTMMNWYALVPVERYYTTPTNGFDSNNNLYNNNNIGSSDGRSSSSNTGGRRMTTIVAKLGESRNATIIDDVGVQPSGHVTLPTYTRDMAREAIRPAPWVCGSNDDYSTDQSDDEQHEIQSTVSSSIEGERHIFSFVHVYKSAGSTIRTFFRQYAEICHKSWMLLVSCKDHRNPSTHHSSSISIRALEAGKGEETYWKGCKIKEMYIRPDDLISNNSMLSEDSIDIYGGHFRIGIVGNDNETAFGNKGDDTGSNNSAGQHSSIRQQSPRPSSSSTAVIRHIVFLRDPMARFVSGILYQHQRSAQFDGTLDGAVRRIKKNVRGSRKKQEYWIRSLNYLLTQSQASNFATMRKKIMDVSNIATLEESMNSMAEIESRTAIQNLVQYNVIVGMVERMDQSMTILRHVFVSHTDDNNRHHGSASAATSAVTTANSQYGQNKIDELFNGFGGSSSKSGNTPGGGDVVDKEELESSKENIRMNASGQEGVTTELVLEELKKDTTFMPLFVEYVKYEQRIHDYAWEMHEMQYIEAGVR